MKLICELTDEIVLGTPGRSEQPPRRTVRAIVRNGVGQYALVWSGGWGIHSLPGGGVEPGEDLLTALRREVLEETGCECLEIRELGLVRENRACQDYTQDNYYYVVDAAKPGELHLTAEEQRNQVRVGWYSLEEAIRRISQPRFERIQGRYFQARDMAALEVYRGKDRTDPGETR